jgi:hypothetical protein
LVVRAERYTNVRGARKVADAGLASFPEPSEGGAEYQVANVRTEHDDPVFFKEVADGEDTSMAATSETLYAIFKGFPVSAPPMHRATPIGDAVNSKFLDLLRMTSTMCRKQSPYR